MVPFTSRVCVDKDNFPLTNGFFLNYRNLSMLLIRKEKLPYFPGLTERAIDVKRLERFKRYWK